MDAGKEIWVFLETFRGRILAESFEAAAACTSLSGRLGCTAVGVLWGAEETCDADRARLLAIGLRRAIRLKAAQAGEGDDTECSMLWALRCLCGAKRPAKVFFGATDLGGRLAPQLAALLGLGCVSEATYFGVVGESVHVTRPILGGSVAEIVRQASEETGCIVRVLRKAFEVDFSPSALSGREPGKLEIEEIPSPPPPMDGLPEKKTLATIPDDARTMDLEDAPVVVAGGKGIGSERGFQLLEGLAEALGGTVAASRVAVDLGWAPREKLVGQTGRKVSPELYIACGISGASQHIAGMKGARFVLAINTDPNAPIYRYATWGIVGDAISCVAALREVAMAYTRDTPRDGPAR